MIRPCAGLLLCLALAAGEAPPLLTLAPEAQAQAVRALVAPTQVHLPGGRCTLEAAATALAVGGNRVVLAEGLDPRSEAELPPVDGAWWEAVRTVCVAFGLRFDPGIPGDEDVGGEGHRVPVGHGTLVLSSDAAGSPAFACEGAIAVVAEPEAVRTAAEGTRLAVRLWLRAEPRLPRGSLAWARAEEPVIDRSGVRTPLDALPEGDGPRQPAALLGARLEGAGAALGALSAQLRLAPVERWAATVALKPGQIHAVDRGGRRIELALHLAPGAIEWQGNPLPDRRPMLLLTGPGDLLDGVQVALAAGGAEVGLRGSSSRNGNDGQRAVMRFLRAAPEGDVTASLNGRAAVAPVPLAISLPLTPLVPAAAAAAADPDAPAHVAWTAGRAPLSRWLAALAATGNPVLLEVGIPAEAPVEVPAVAGSFWDAVLALCRAADLQPAVTPGSAIAGGPLRLSRRGGRPLAAAACGPLLALATASPATITAGGRQERQLRLDLALLAVPRLPPERFGLPTATWASFASDQDGATRTVIVPAGSETPGDAQALLNRVQALGGRRQAALQIDGDEDEAASTLGATIRLAGGEREVAVSGMLLLPRVRTMRTSAEVAVGTPAEVVVGGQVVEVLARNGKTPGPTMPGLPAEATGILLRGLSGIDSVSLSAALADGGRVDGNSGANHLGGSGAVPQWFAWCRVPAEGRLTVEIAAQSPQQPLILPLRIVVPVP